MVDFKRRVVANNGSFRCDLIVDIIDLLMFLLSDIGAVAVAVAVSAVYKCCCLC